MNGRPSGDSKQIAILLSLYRPNLDYLAELLASIKSQHGVTVRLLCRVDDLNVAVDSHCVAIVKRSFPDAIILLGKNIGPAFSFYELLNSLRQHKGLGCDYFAFCDQDDYWLPEKLANAIELMERCNANGYASRVIISDESLKPLGLSKMPANVSFTNAICENVIFGCTFVGSIGLLSDLTHSRPSALSMHDSWVYLCCTAFHKLVFDDKSYIQYRQHGGNVVGASGKLNLFIRYVKNLLTVQASKERETAQLSVFYEIFSERLSAKNRKNLELYLSIRSSIGARIKSLWVFKRNDPLPNLALKIKILTGLV